MLTTNHTRSSDSIMRSERTAFSALIAAMLLFSSAQSVRAEGEGALAKAKKVTEKLNPVSAAKRATEKLSSLKDNDEKPEKVRDKWALIVGVEKFLDNSITGIKGAERSAVFTSELLANPNLGRFGKGHVVIVTNSKATSSNISKVLGEPWLLKHALPNDLVLLYFNTRYKVSEDGTDLILYSFDTQSASPATDSIKLKEQLENIKRRSQSSRILCLLDISPIDQTVKPDESLLSAIADASGTTIYAANKIGDKSYFYPVSGTSFFVNNLAEGMAAGQGNLDFKTVADYINQTLPGQVTTEWKKDQTPVLAVPSGNDALMKTALGVEVKSSTPQKTIKIGHPVDQVTPSKPKVVTTRRVIKTTSNPSAPRPATNEKATPVKMGSVDFGTYMQKMKRDIQAKWTPPKGFRAHHIVTVFSIKSDGEIVNASVVDGSGNAAVDKSALKALEMASPLDPLPEGSPPYVQIRYQFDWKVSKNK